LKPTPDIRKRLIEIGKVADDDVDLFGTALLLGTIDRPPIRLAAYHRHLEQLKSSVDGYLSGVDATLDILTKADALAQILHRRYGYVGTEEAFQDPEGANITRVIDCRSGLPISIGILYLVTARSLGWAIDGLDFPGRFLVRLDHDGERLIIDPFGGGRVLETQDLRDILKTFSGYHAELKPRHFKAMSTRQILLRLQGNIRGRLLRTDRIEDAISVIETMLLFAPGEAELWRECGLLHSRLDNVADAIVALEEYLKLSANTDVRYGTSVLLQELRLRLN
jgi:regulator of sirC expression with transglutaminase-like and TPR domain